MMRKAIVPIAAMVVLVAIGIVAKIPWWALLGLEILAAVGGYFYLKNEGKKYQEFTPYVGNLIGIIKRRDVISYAYDKIKSDESYMEDFFHAKKLSR